MYAQVALLNGFEKPLWYKIPSHLESVIHKGSVVHVPLQRRKETALVTAIFPALKQPVSFAIKEISELSIMPPDTLYTSFVNKMAHFYLLEPLYFYQRTRRFLEEHDEEVLAEAPEQPAQPIVTLTAEQQAVTDYLEPFITTPTYTPTLLHGVTGSGKTEVYKKLIQKAIEANKTVVLLLPEVTLALQFQHLLQAQLPGIQVLGFHSATKIAEKRMLWQSLVASKPILIIGVHLPILLPIANLGLIIIDEEHETGFTEKKHPKLNSKEMSLWRAHHYQIPILLGSATPSLTSLYNVKRHGWKMFQITQRFAGSFPTIKKVLLIDPTTRRRKNFWISKPLQDAIVDRLAKKEQIIIFLNRRGYSFFVQCKGCGFIFQCPHCSVSLTLHVTTNSTLRCHYCDYAKPLPSNCPTCKAGEKELLKKGIGTQQLVQVFQDLFPHAVIQRADMDSTKKKREWQQTVDGFKNGSIDILIGTQTITKGYHFPNVTLVGVLWADLNLHFPQYNASETTLQQLIQVAGRAGRARAGGLVIIQTMQDHAIFDYLNETDYIKFCDGELEFRNEGCYPPFYRLACIELKSADETQIANDGQQLTNFLIEHNEMHQLGVDILGPALPIVNKVQNYHMRHILLKSASFKNLHQLLSHAQSIEITSSIFIVVNS